MEIVLWAVFILMFGGQYLLPRFGPKWAGAPLLAVWAGLVVFAAVQGYMTSFRDYIMAALGFFLLLVLWGAGIDKKKLASEEGGPETR